MKTYYLFLIIIMILSCSSSKTVTKVDDSGIKRDYRLADYVGHKKKLAIAKFENATRFGQRRLGDHISDLLATELSETQRFILLDRQNVDQILEQVALSQTGLTEGELQQIQLMDADFLLTGTVTHYSVTTTGTKNIFKKAKIQKAEVAADVRMINIRSGEIILSETGRGIAEKKYEEVLGMGESGGYDESLEMDAFRAAVIKLTENIIPKIDRIPWACDVVQIAETRLYIDAGRKSNIRLGEEVEIYRRGSAIKNLSGFIIGFEESFVCTGQVTDFIGEDGAVINVQISNKLELPLLCKMPSRNQP